MCTEWRAKLCIWHCQYNLHTLPVQRKVPNAAIHPFTSVPLIYYHQAPISGDYIAILNFVGYWGTFFMSNTCYNKLSPHIHPSPGNEVVQISMLFHEILYDLKRGVLMLWMFFTAWLACSPVKWSPSLVYKILQIATNWSWWRNIFYKCTVCLFYISLIILLTSGLSFKPKSDHNTSKLFRII